MSIAGSNIGSAKVASASGNQKVGAGAVLGILCTASTSGTFALYDDPATGTSVQLVPTCSMAAGTFLPLNIAFQTGINLVVGGTGTFVLVIA